MVRVLFGQQGISPEGAPDRFNYGPTQRTMQGLNGACAPQHAARFRQGIPPRVVRLLGVDVPGFDAFGDCKDGLKCSC